MFPSIYWPNLTACTASGLPDPPVAPARDGVCAPCLTECDRVVFDRVLVSHLLRGGTRVMWELVDTFRDPTPHTFQLEVGRTANQDADDWETVGLPVDDTFYSIDDEQRLYGKTNWTHYRVRLTTSVGEYLSTPVNLLGILEFRDWRIAREIDRKERLHHSLGAQEGYLLKVRMTGDACECVDTMTGESRNPECALCYGTAFRCGYLYPMGCVWAALQPRGHYTTVDGQLVRGTINDVITVARMSAVAPLFKGDVWVARRTDDRYLIHEVQHVAEYRGVPLVAQVKMQLLPVTSPIYGIEIPDQVVVEH